MRYYDLRWGSIFCTFVHSILLLIYIIMMFIFFVKRWNEHNIKKEDEFRKLYPVLTITIYGSYQPESETRKLKEIKNFLIKQGFTQTKLVIDYQDPKTNSIEVSKECIKFSDVNFFVITSKGSKLGVTRELGYLVDDKDARKNIINSTIFDEMKSGSSTLSTLTLDDIDDFRLTIRQWINQMSLDAALLSEARHYVKMLREILENRLEKMS